MQIPEVLKKPPVIIGGVVLVVIILVISRKSGTTASGSSGDYSASVASANSQIAQLNAGNEAERIRAGVSVASIEAQRQVALAKLASDEITSLTTSDYQYNVANKQLENNRILGLTQEDTRRLVSTQETDARLRLGMSELDTNRYIATRALESQEVQQARELQYRVSELEANERINDINTSRSLTYASISGQNQTAAIKASKPSAWTTFLGSLGGGLGKGLTSFLNPVQSPFP